jgi:hypothetical protein
MQARPVIAGGVQKTRRHAQVLGESLCDINTRFDARQLRDTSARRKIKLTNKLRD